MYAFPMILVLLFVPFIWRGETALFISEGEKALTLFFNLCHLVSMYFETSPENTSSGNW